MPITRDGRFVLLIGFPLFIIYVAVACIQLRSMIASIVCILSIRGLFTHMNRELCTRIQEQFLGGKLHHQFEFNVLHNDLQQLHARMRTAYNCAIKERCMLELHHKETRQPC